MKKLISLLIVLIMVISLMPVTHAYDFGIKIGDNVMWLFDKGTVTISGTGDTWDLTEATNPPYINYNISSITIEAGVTSIGNYVFSGLQGSLGEVIIPDTVTRIGDSAFAGCQFWEVKIPESVKTIGDGAFMGCKKLTDINIPQSVTSIGSGGIFFCYDALESVDLGSNIKVISENMFCGCESLKSVTIPDGVTK